MKNAVEMKEFEKVTVVFKGEFFGLDTVHCKVLRLAWGPYAQYPKATELRFRKPRQRKDRGLVKSYDQTMVVLEGFVEPYDNFETEQKVPGLVTKRGKFASCDPAWNNELLEYARNCGAKVLYAQDKRAEPMNVEALVPPARPDEGPVQGELAF